MSSALHEVHDARVLSEARERASGVEDAATRARLGVGDDVPGEVADCGDGAHAGAAPGAERRATCATMLATPNETRKLGTVAPIPQSGGFSFETASTHH